jgi:penicillin-binding protein 1A
MKKPNPIYSFFWKADSFFSSWGFEVMDALRRGFSAYSSFLHRFRISGLRRVAVDLVDDAATFGTVFAIGLLAFALPPFSGTGDIWNKGREYAVTFTDVNGEIIGRRGIRQDDALPLEEIPPHVIKAVLATEDARFFDHFGVDVQGTLRAIIQNARANDVVQGGSSLTQQVAKNLFLSPERTIRRKVHEAFLALWIEARLTKEEILKLYLDRSYLGGGTYGVEAAAQYYFGKSIRDVNLSEAAMLAGLFKAPSNYAPHANLEAARARANVVLYRMLAIGAITQGELLEARREPATAINQNQFESPDWFLDWAYKDTLALLEQNRITGDYVIEVKTTIDPVLQAASQRIINETLAGEAVDYDVSQAASVTMEADGAIKAIVGGRDYQESQFNRATDALRQPGSSYKPFVYLAALLAGYTSDTAVVDSPVSIGNWSPKNYTGKYVGRTTLMNALAHSYNSIPVKLMLDVGRKAIIETTHAVGVQGEIESVPSLPLGSSAMTLLDITTGYATFAGGGRLARPYTVLEIRRPNGDVLYSREKQAPPPVQAVPEPIIADLNRMLNAVVRSGTGRRADLGFTPQAGKTGTNQSYRDAWYIGFTAHYVTGVWFGNDDFHPMNKVTGGLLPAATWKSIMLQAEQTKTAAALPGIPLDDSYAKFAAQNQPELEIVALPKPDPQVSSQDIPQAPASGSQAQVQGQSGGAPIQIIPEGPNAANQVPIVRVPAVRTTRTAIPDEVSDEVVVVRQRPRRDPVAAVFQDMFGLFSNDSDEPRQKVRTKKSASELILPLPNTGKSKETALDRLRKRKNRN